MTEWDEYRYHLLEMTELASQQPGYWSHRRYIDQDGTAHDYLHFNCPCGCKYGDAVRLVDAGTPHDGHTWDWNGSIERPTLSPSLQRNTPCRWHGYINNGEWSVAGGSPPLSPNIYRAGMMPAPETHTTRWEDVRMAENPEADAEQAAAAESPPAAETCKGGPRDAHTWAAQPTGDDPYRHVCIHCGDTLTEGQPSA